MNRGPAELIIAHRGESFVAPENTLAAINLAWKNGAVAVEIDVHLTQDRKIVVIHDKDTNRTGSQNKTIRKSRFEELRKIDVGGFKGLQWKNETIPLLSEVLQTVPDNGKLVIEIKCGKEIIPHLVTEIKRSKLDISRIDVISFNIKVLSEIKKRIPEYKMLWLLELDYKRPAWLVRMSTGRMLRKTVRHKLDGVDVWARKVLNEDFVARFKSHGLLVYAWTVNDAQTAGKLIEMGVDGITTNRPGWLRSELINRNKDL